MNIAVIGTGYVGLVAGTCLAETGNRVLCIDKDSEKVRWLRQGHLSIYEPGLETLFRRATAQGRLTFGVSLKEAVDHAEILFLALPTPENEDGSADLSHVLDVVHDLAQLIKERKLVVMKSTVPVGTAARAREIFLRSHCPAVVASNPEFMREGFAVEDFMKPDRIVIGATDPWARQILAALYQPFLREDHPILFMSEESAELTKYAANTFLAMKISFMNELARLAEGCGANIDDIRLALGADDRIGGRFLFAGLGYGGSCLPKDVKALVHQARVFQVPLRLAEAVQEVNTTQLDFFLTKILRHFEGQLSGRHFAVWGLAFKPDTDDVREAPALKIIRFLFRHGASVRAFDPEASANALKQIPDLEISSDMYQALEGADALILCTEWSLFRSPDFDVMAQKLKYKVIFDGRNVYQPDEVRRRGFTYYSIGRP
ncbi:MAG: UDP-glucose/GDP-mannose dehydrogenase family protein [Flavobacteriales bacterium]|nr:UDP-glucose/GDP-mannose dehydrogenase family protein [Flavobacteriales bacterium]